MRLALGAAAFALSLALGSTAAADEEPPPPPLLVVTPPNAEPVKDVAPRPTNEPIGTQRFLGAIAGAAGFITAAVGGFLVLSANTAYADAESQCRKHCTQEDIDDGASAHDRANAGGIVLVAGLAVLGGGIALWFTAPKPVKADAPKTDAPPPQARVGIAPTFGGLSAVGTF